MSNAALDDSARATEPQKNTPGSEKSPPPTAPSPFKTAMQNGQGPTQAQFTDLALQMTEQANALQKLQQRFLDQAPPGQDTAQQNTTPGPSGAVGDKKANAPEKKVPEFEENVNKQLNEQAEKLKKQAEQEKQNSEKIQEQVKQLKSLLESHGPASGGRGGVGLAAAMIIALTGGLIGAGVVWLVTKPNIEGHQKSAQTATDKQIETLTEGQKKLAGEIAAQNADIKSLDNRLSGVTDSNRKAIEALSARWPGTQEEMKKDLASTAQTTKDATDVQIKINAESAKGRMDALEARWPENAAKMEQRFSDQLSAMQTSLKEINKDIARNGTGMSELSARWPGDAEKLKLKVTDDVKKALKEVEPLRTLQNAPFADGSQWLAKTGVSGEPRFAGNLYWKQDHGDLALTWQGTAAEIKVAMENKNKAFEKSSANEQTCRLTPSQFVNGTPEAMTGMLSFEVGGGTINYTLILINDDGKLGVVGVRGNK